MNMSMSNFWHTVDNSEADELLFYDISIIAIISQMGFLVLVL